jgi:hypothetical protein
MKNLTTTQLWTKRSRGRGVAMVEAGILAPIFAMMMMLTTYLGGVYEAKYRSVMKERYLTWYFSSSGCSNSPPNASTDGAATPQQDTGGGDPCNQAQGESQAKSSMFVAHAYDEEIWSYQPTLKFNGGIPKKVHTDGYVVCNEKQVPKGVGGILDQLANEASSAFSGAYNGSSGCN